MVSDSDRVKAVNVLIREIRKDVDHGWLDKADQKCLVAIELLEGVPGAEAGPIDDAPRDLSEDFFSEAREMAREMIKSGEIDVEPDESEA